MREHTNFPDFGHLLPASLLAGLIGGGLLVFLTSCVHAWCWDGIPGFRYGIFESISSIQYILLGTLTLFLSGMLAVVLRPVETRAQAFLVGGISGFTVFLVNEIHFNISLLLGQGSTDLAGDLIHNLSYQLASFPLQFLFMALVMTGLAVLGAFILFSFSEKAAGPEEETRASLVIPGSKVLIILVVLVLPPLAAHMMSGAKMVSVNPSETMISTHISLERTAPDAIILTAHEVPAGSHFSVYLDGVDVSNASASASKGFVGTVEPSDGLQAIGGSEATWQGAGVMSNGTPLDFTIKVHGADGSEIVVLNRQI